MNNLKTQFISEMNELINRYYPAKKLDSLREMADVLSVDDIQAMENFDLPAEIKLIKKILEKDIFLRDLYIEVDKVGVEMSHDSIFWFLPGVKDFKYDLQKILNQKCYQSESLLIFDLNALHDKSISIEQKLLDALSENDKLKKDIDDLKNTQDNLQQIKDENEVLHFNCNDMKNELTKLQADKDKLTEKVKELERKINPLPINQSPAANQHVINPANEQSQKACRK